MKSVLRWIAGALLGPILAFILVLQIPTEHSGQATAAGMANIAYVVILIRHLAIFGVLYGILFPVLSPQGSTRPLATTLVGASIGVALLVPLYGQLDMARIGGADFYASVTWRNAIIASGLSVLITYFVGLRKNASLASADYWSRLLRRT